MPAVAPSGRRVLFRVLAVSLGVLAAGVAAEGTLRLLGRPLPMQVGWHQYPGSRFPPQETNQLGWRGQPIEYGDDDYVVVLLGDSQVQAQACAFEWMPERRLQCYLSEAAGRSVKVFTVGVAGFGQDQQLLALRQYFASHRADLVVEWLTPTNDVKDNTWPTSMPIDGRRKPTFWLEDGELRGPNALPGWLPLAPLRLLEAARRMLAGSLDARWERDHLPPRYQPLTDYDGPVRTEWQERHDACMLLEQALQREKCDNSLLLTPPSERTRYGVKLTNLLLKEIRAEAAAHGAGYVLFRVDKGDHTAECDGVYALQGKLYRATAAQLEDNIRQLAEGLDLLTIPVRVWPWRVGPLDYHLNQHANDDVMRQLAEQLRGLL